MVTGSEEATDPKYDFKRRPNVSLAVKILNQN